MDPQPTDPVGLVLDTPDLAGRARRPADVGAIGRPR